MSTSAPAAPLDTVIDPSPTERETKDAELRELAAVAARLLPQYPDTRGERGTSAFYRALALAAVRMRLAPNKNMLYVAAGRRGSMSTAEAGLEQALATLSKLLPTLERPGIPDALRDEAAGLLAQIFALADEQAAQRLRQERATLRSQQEAAAAALAERQALQAEVERLAGDLSVRNEQLERLRLEAARDAQVCAEAQAQASALADRERQAIAAMSVAQETLLAQTAQLSAATERAIVAEREASSLRLREAHLRRLPALLAQALGVPATPVTGVVDALLAADESALRDCLNSLSTLVGTRKAVSPAATKLGKLSK